MSRFTSLFLCCHATAAAGVICPRLRLIHDQRHARGAPECVAGTANGSTCDPVGRFSPPMVMVDEPKPTTDAGLKLDVPPSGRPLTVNVTVPAEPPEDVTVTA